MGICTSYEYIFEENANMREWRPQFEALKLTTSEVGKLYEIFRSIDKDNSGLINMDELLNQILMDATEFRNRVFSILDEDGSGEIDFREFVLSMWNYCTLTKATLGMIFYNCFSCFHRN
jgi:serine/threonine-protein phosphatase 2B regulatory subunit